VAVYQTFRCTGCDHDHYGFEGDSATMREWLRAVICAKCDELSVLGLGPTTDCEGRTLETQPPREPRCRSCRSRRVKIWHAENGCPKCGSTMEVDHDGPSICAD